MYSEKQSWLRQAEYMEREWKIVKVNDHHYDIVADRGLLVHTDCRPLLYFMDKNFQKYDWDKEEEMQEYLKACILFARSKADEVE